MNPQLQYMLHQAVQAFQGGNFDSADSILKSILQVDSRNLPALHILGLIKISQSNYKEAADYLAKAARIHPNDASLQYNLAKALSDSGNDKDAVAHHKKAVALAPKNPEAWISYGKTAFNLGRFEDALVWYGNALSLKPNYHEAWSSKGVTLHELKRFDEAIAHFDKALNLKPDYHEAWSNKGVTLHKLKKYDEAIVHYDKALSLKPDYHEAWFNKGIALNEIARALDARACFEKALEQKPDFHKARWAKLFTSIPVIANGNENFQELREEFSFELEKLSEWLLGEDLDEAHEVIGSIQPFYLAYQELNNKQLLNKYGELCCRLMNKWGKFYNFQHRIKTGNRKIKLGIVGEQIHNHSVWNAITRGLVFNLDASRFEIHIFHLGSTVDEETHSARLKAASFTNNQFSLLEWTRVIVEKNIDVLLYPEIGMDSITIQLASLRLAPLQITAWGHPETTGLPTINYYLSAELFEDESSQDAYTETLVKLPNLGCSYSRLSITSTKFDFEVFGINPNEPILICPGTPYKYAPQYDWILVKIAKRLGKGKLIFFNIQNNLTEILKLRLEKVFNEADLVFGDYVVFIPWQKSEEFYGLMKRADVYLDTIGFSGFNTAMQAVDCALPIVARESKFMRGRLASGILKRMAIPELIVKTDEAYVDLVVRLAQDRLYRNQIKKRIIESRDILYDDNEPIQAFENFLLGKVEHFSEL